MSLSPSSRFSFPANSGVLVKKEKSSSTKYNATINFLLNSLNTLDGELFGSQRFLQLTAPPRYLTTLTISVANILCRDSTNQFWLYNPNTVVLDAATTGVNGCSQSSVLTGRVNAAASTTITGTGTQFLTDYRVGDILYGSSTQCARITAIASDLSLTVATALTLTNSAHRRGARPQDLTASSTAGWYLYVINNGVSSNLFLSTRDVSSGDPLVDLPTGYTRFRQLPFYIIGNGNAGVGKLENFNIVGGWPYNPRILYSGLVGTGTADVNTYGSQPTSALTGIQSTNLRPGLPKFACTGIVKFILAAAAGPLSINLGDSSAFTNSILHNFSVAANGHWLDVPINSDGTLFWRNNAGTPSTAFFPVGYVVGNWL